MGSACPLVGQALLYKTHDTLKIAIQWTEIDNLAVSNDGNWHAFRKHFRTQNIDTVYLVNRKKAITHKIANGNLVQFSENSEWCIVRSFPHSYKLVNLKSGYKKKWDQNSTFRFLNTSNTVLIHYKEDHKVEVIKSNNPALGLFENVLDIKIQPNEKHLALILKNQNKYQLQLVETNSFEEIWQSKEEDLLLAKPTFSKQSGTLAYFSKVNNSNASQLNVIDFTSDQCNIKSISPKDTFQEDNPIGFSTGYLELSPDGNNVYFKTIYPINTPKLSNDVEIWKSTDTWLYPKLKRDYMRNEAEYAAVWDLNNGEITAIETPKFPHAKIQYGVDNIILFEKESDNPKHWHLLEKQVYVNDLKTNTKFKLLNDYFPHSNTLSLSPSGRYVRYFKDKNWWVYDSKLKKHINVSEQITEDLIDEDYDKNDIIKVFGSPGWSTHEEGVLIYGKYDIWWAAVDGTEIRRLTQGYKDKIQFRLIDLKKTAIDFKMGTEKDNNIFNLNEDVWVEALTDDYATGLYRWHYKKGLEKILLKDARLDQWVCSDNKKWCTYRQQRFNKPPSINGIEKEKDIGVLIQSNLHFTKTPYGSAELINYFGSNGKILKGALFYPVDFNPNKKYPMVVHIYERQSKSIHRFFLPVLNQSDGFSPSIYTNDGYIVLLPDIAYEIGRPGYSALKNVENAIDKVIEKGIVEQENIGLIGHSFGGYQTNLIITMTDRFKAAVAGASITDIISHYHSVGEMEIEEMWRYEHEQIRMGEPFHSIPNAYLQNSPIYHAKNIKTPLLLWTGINDYTVKENQSTALFLALRRMQKEVVLLKYPEEGHTLKKMENQIHLSQSIKHWIDLYLKD